LRLPFPLARGRVGGEGEGAQRWVSAARCRRNGRVAPYAAARLTGRARGHAGRQNAGNAPAHPTSPFSPQSARGEPRHVGCSALATLTQRQVRGIRGRAAHRARTRARRAAKCGQFSGASNEPVFAAIGARGAAPSGLRSTSWPCLLLTSWVQCKQGRAGGGGGRNGDLWVGVVPADFVE
jgi:hypothetical protein